MKTLKKFLCVCMVLCMLSACAKDSKNDSSNAIESSSQQTTTVQSSSSEAEKKAETPVGLLKEERDSIKVGKLSKDHIYYQEVVGIDPECANYINEISIFDKEINDTFIVHVSLPPNYKKENKYPMVLMTDGVWRLSDHPELRPLMVKGEVEDVILVSVGYPNSYDYRTIRERDLLKAPDKYLHFLVDNLVPYLNEQYSIDNKRLTLTGHSYGGFWGFYALFNSDTIGKNTFANYYIGSPSFQAQYNGQFIEDFEKQYYARKKELNCRVYVTVGDKEGTSFINPIDNFIDTLKKRNYSGLDLKYEIIKDFDHNTVFKPSIKNTLLMFYGKKK